MKNINYKNRIVDEILKFKLESKGAVLIQGAKWCGKTTTAEQIANSVVYMQDPAINGLGIDIVGLNPNYVLDGDTPRLIDEWQISPKIWDLIRYEIDHRNSEGQFILTGSAVPADMSKTSHTGTGRFSWLTMRPMSLFESGESNGSVSLGELFNNNFELKGTSDIKLKDIAFLCARGGWPRSIFMKDKAALSQAYDYIDAVIQSDISRVDNVNRKPRRVENLLKSYARNIGTQVSADTIRKDMISNDTSSLSLDTIYSYLEALNKIFVIEESEAWNPNLRSKTSIRTTCTRYFVDPSIAVAALGIGPNDLMNDLNTLGFIFENMVIRDLKTYSQRYDGKVYHYRDSLNLECDAVIHLRNGSYGLVEIKLGGEKLIEEGAKNLLKLKKNIDTTKMKEPSFEMIVTAVGDFPYQRTDGIIIVPIGLLGP